MTLPRRLLRHAWTASSPYYRPPHARPPSPPPRRRHHLHAPEAAHSPPDSSITHSRPPSPPHLLLHALGIEAVGHRIVNLRLHLDRQSAHEFRHLLPRRHSPRAAYTDVRSREATSMPRPTTIVLRRSPSDCTIVSGRSDEMADAISSWQDRPSRQALLETDS